MSQSPFANAMNAKLHRYMRERTRKPGCAVLDFPK